MKKLLSLFLAVVMAFMVVVPTISAVGPEEKCMAFGDGSGSYAYFNRISLNPTNCTISFDLAMVSNSNGTPLLRANSYGTNDFEIGHDYVILAGTRQAISWGELSLKHWRHVDITYNGGTATIALDGEAVVSASATYQMGNLYFLGFPGNIHVDNFVMTSGGNEVLNLTFEDTAAYANATSDDSTVVVSDVEAGSYYDYDPVVYPDNAEYIFDSEEDAALLGVPSGESYAKGDINEDNKVNIFDILILKKIMAQTLELEDYELGRVDVFADGKINIKDSLILKKTVNGTIDVEYVESEGKAVAEYVSDYTSAMLTTEEAVEEGIDATLTMDAVSAEDYKYAVVTYMVPGSTEDKNSDVATQAAFGAGDTLTIFDLSTDGKFHAQVVDLSALDGWDGTSATLRFFVAAEAGDRIYIDSIIFTAAEHLANKAGAARVAAKGSLGIYDEVESGELAYVDDNGSVVVRFDAEEKVAAYVSDGNNTNPTFTAEEDSKGSLKATARAGADPSFYVDLTSCGISADTYKYITYVYKIPTTTQRVGPIANMYYVCGAIDVPTGGYETAAISLKKNSAYNSQIYDLTGNSNWSGDVKGLRVDYFTDCYAGDVAYIDSIIFSKTQANATDSSRARLIDRNGAPEALDVQGVWNLYWSSYQNANSNEFISGSANDLKMYFRYGSNAAFTARSLGDRMARAISEATGYEVECEIYNGFVDLKSQYDSSSEPNGYIYYTLKYNGESYIVWLNTSIIKTSGYKDALDGTSADPVITYGNSSTWTSEGISISDSTTFMTTDCGNAYHSNHENRMVDTPYGTFAVIPTWYDTSRWGEIGASEFNLYEIYEDGSSKVLATYSCGYHTSKPNIYYYNGKVFFVQADDQTSYMSVGIGYFDPASPNADGTYNISYSRTSRSYQGGASPGGYGYIQPILDDVNGKITVMACGGKDAGYLSWSNYNLNTRSWEGGAYTTVLGETYRHCYLQGYPDGNGGLYVVGNRDVLLSTLGLAGTVTGADYAWDEANLFHFPSIYSTGYTMQHVNKADYTQTGRSLFPLASNSFQDVYLAQDGYLHVMTSTSMHGTFHHDTKYWEMFHTVYDVRTPGMKPVEIYDEPIAFISPTNNYSMRMTESTDGTLYVFAMPKDKAARCEVWRQSDENGFEFELVACRNFSDSATVSSAMIIGNSRNGSVIDNNVRMIYPAENGGSIKYKYFTITLP